MTISATTFHNMDYGQKSQSYFHGERRDFVDSLKQGKLSFLEIGCGNGATARYAIETGRVKHYTGIELFPNAANAAEPFMDKLVVGDVEKETIPRDFAPYDVVIMSEVLEHLVDPWALLRKIAPLLKADADVFASSPSIAHHSVIRMLISGRWDLTDFGRMDRTHLRWFTPSSYAAMFSECGYQVRAVRSLTNLSPRSKLIQSLLPKRFRHLFIGQMMLHANPLFPQRRDDRPI